MKRQFNAAILFRQKELRPVAIRQNRHPTRKCAGSRFVGRAAVHKNCLFYPAGWLEGVLRGMFLSVRNCEVAITEVALPCWCKGLLPPRHPLRRKELAPMSACCPLVVRPIVASSLSLALLLPLVTAGCGQSSADVNPIVGDAATVSLPAQLPSDDQLRQQLDEAIAITASRTLVADDNAAWQVVHGILAFGPDLKVQVNGKELSAQEYLLSGGRLKGWILSQGDKGVESLLEAGSKTGQGHEDQWLGYLSLSGLKADTPIKVGDKTYKVIDLLTQAQWDIYPGMESTWTLMALSSYLPMDVKWKNKRGEDWTIDRVVKMEAEQDIARSACGGTHRLVGLTVAVNRHVKEGGPLIDGWKAANDQIRGFIKLAQDNQQADGTFSTNYFLVPAQNSPDVGEQIGTTGHTLEFLALAMTDDELKQPWLTRAAARLCELVVETKDFPLECGGLYHASRGMKLYRERRFGPPSAPAQPMRGEPKSGDPTSNGPAITPVAETKATQR